MATLNSIDGTIISAGNNPPLNTDLICTLYRMDFLPTGGSIEYINHTGSTRKWSFSKFALSDRICKIISISGVQLTDLGLAFNIPAPSQPVTFMSPQINVPLQVKSYRVYFGTPTKPQGIISYYDELGAIKHLNMIGTTTTIKATKFNQLSNMRIVDLNPEIPAIAPVAAAPLSITTGSYGTILTPVRTAYLPYMNPAKVDLLSGGINPTLNKLFAATNYEMIFPEENPGIIEYEDVNGKVKKYTLTRSQVMTEDNILRDIMTKLISISNVKLIDKGLVYQIAKEVTSIMPTQMPLIPSKPKFYQVYFGNPVYTQGSIVYFDSKGINKMITNFGKVMTIDASRIDSMANVKIVEVGDVI
jgi:hypothetical protein